MQDEKGENRGRGCGAAVLGGRWRHACGGLDEKRQKLHFWGKGQMGDGWDKYHQSGRGGSRAVPGQAGKR